KVATVQ
nr:Chain C, LYS-VAL-ALA-THR-VAL-GLN [Severe acute respiratory syndrome coronavirus 2]